MIYTDQLFRLYCQLLKSRISFRQIFLDRYSLHSEKLTGSVDMESKVKPTISWLHGQKIIPFRLPFPKSDSEWCFIQYLDSRSHIVNAKKLHWKRVYSKQFIIAFFINKRAQLEDPLIEISLLLNENNLFFSFLSVLKMNTLLLRTLSFSIILGCHQLLPLHEL